MCVTVCLSVAEEGNGCVRIIGLIVDWMRWAGIFAGIVAGIVSGIGRNWPELACAPLDLILGVARYLLAGQSGWPRGMCP